MTHDNIPEQTDHLETPETQTIETERVIASNDRYYVTVGSELGEDIAEILWQKNQAGFEDLNATSLNRQNMTREEYDADVQSPGVLKYTVYAKPEDGQASDNAEAAVGMLFVHRDASRVDYLNQDYLSEHLPGFEEGNFFYISTLVVEQDHRGIEASGLLIRGVGEDLYRRKHETGDRYGAVMDFAQANDGLPGYIAYCLNSEDYGGSPLPLKVEQLGAQSYRILDPGEGSLAMPDNVQVLPSIEDEGLRDRLWSTYDRAATATEGNSPSRQRLSREEFGKFLADEQIDKLVANDASGADTYVIFVAKGLSVLDHLSPSFAAAHTNGKSVRYLIGAGVLDAQAGEAAAGIAAATALAQVEGSVLLYDTDTRNERLENEFATLTGQRPVEIDHQTYWSIRPIPAEEPSPVRI